jgi:signal transduction histidine kinase
MDAIKQTEKMKLVDENDVSKEEMYQFLIQNTNDLIAVLNENLEHEIINEPAYLKVLGYSEVDLIGKNPQDFIHPEDIPRVANAIKKGLKKGDVSEIIKECVENIRYFAKERKITILLELLDNIICEIDKLRIEQVITNLLSNAIKNTPPNGLVKVILSRNEDAIYISVQDSGVGLTLGEMDKLFNKFGKIERYGQRMNFDI